MKFYDDTKPLYLETVASRVGLGAALLQLHDNTTCQKGMVPDNIILHPIPFASKSLTGAVRRYSNIEWEALGILHGLEKFHHYCFSRVVLIITDHKPLVSMFKKDVATLSLHIQHILLKIHQYGVQIIYKPGPKIFIADWLLQYNHAEGKDKPIKDVDIRIDAIQCDWHTRVCVCVTNTAGINTGWPLTMCQKFYNYRLAQYQRWAASWSKTILVLQRWTGHNRQSHVKRQAYGHTKQSQATGAGSTSHKPYGYSKNENYSYVNLFTGIT